MNSKLSLKTQQRSLMCLAKENTQENDLRLTKGQSVVPSIKQSKGVYPLPSLTPDPRVLSSRPPRGPPSHSDNLLTGSIYLLQPCALWASPWSPTLRVVPNNKLVSWVNFWEAYNPHAHIARVDFRGLQPEGNTPRFRPTCSFGPVALQKTDQTATHVSTRVSHTNT